jgi:hypothetical protein
MYVVLEVLRALEFTHSCGIVHGDVRPEKVSLRVGIHPYDSALTEKGTLLIRCSEPSWASGVQAATTDGRRWVCASLDLSAPSTPACTLHARSLWATRVRTRFAVSKCRPASHGPSRFAPGPAVIGCVLTEDQVDLYGVCNLVSMAMHGRPLEVAQQRGVATYETRFRPKLPTKRYARALGYWVRAVCCVLTTDQRLECAVVGQSV